MHWLQPCFLRCADLALSNSSRRGSRDCDHLSAATFDVLRRLTIRSFALIDSIDLEFHPGMTVLLGETGAGKSIIIDALSAAMGERVSSDLVRKGARKSVVEATFDVVRESSAAEFIQQHELDWESDELVLRREIPSNGASRCFVNDTPAQATVVRQLSSLLIDVHGQHDTHGLMSASNHLEAFDAYALTSADTRSLMTMRWSELSQACKRRDELLRRSLDADADRARLQFIHDEIAGVGPQPDEDDRISADLRRFEAGEHVVSLATTVQQYLYSSDASAYDQLRQALEAVRELRRYDPTMEGVGTELESALIICKEAAASVGTLADSDDRDPQRLEELRQRQAALQRLARKYGSLDLAIAKLQAVTHELHEVENLEEVLRDADLFVQNAEQLARSHAESISSQRHAAASGFAEHVIGSLLEMGMPSARFEVALQPSDLGPTGCDHVEFLFAANPGEPPRPLARIASGGELSRVMLALKRALLQRIPTGTVVLDEIDTGISGRVARTVGQVMQQISISQQVICITHLAQIASLSDHFIRVTKSADNGSTTVTASSIEAHQAQMDVAQLISGTDVTDASLAGAQELMQRSVESSRRSRKGA